MIKTLIFFVLFSLLSFTSFSQISLGKTYFESGAVHELKDTQIEKLKATTTHFFIDETLGIDAEDFGDMLQTVWTITPFDVKSKEDFKAVEEEGHSYVIFDNVSMTKTNSKAVWSFHVFDFFMIDDYRKKKNGKIKWDKERFGLVYFTLDIDGRQDVVAKKSTIEGGLMNYNFGYLKNYFKFVNDALLENREFSIEDDYVNKQKLSELKDKTLYFSRKLIYKYNALSIKEKDPVTVEELFGNYNYNYKVVDDDTLNEMILSDDHEYLYYLTYNQINSLKVITITNSKSGDIIYSETKRLSYNLKSKDLKQLSKSIEKSK